MKGSWRLVVGVVGVALVIFAGIPALSAWHRGVIPTGENWDFEGGDLSGWTRAGNAFDLQPTLGDNPRARGRDSAQQQGHWWIGGFEDYQGRPWQQPGAHRGDGPTGTLTSRPFRIEGARLAFLIGGGNHPWVAPDGPGATAVNLVVDGLVVRSATGGDSESMRLEVWDVSDLVGKTAVVEVADHSSDPWGHVNFDDLHPLSRWDAERGDLLLYLWTGGVLVLLAVSHWSGAWRVMLALTGLLLLAVSALHDAPWSMRFVHSEWTDGRIWITCFTPALVLSVGVLQRCIVAVLAGIVPVSDAGRAAVSSLVRQPRRFVRVIGALACLAATLVPTQYGWWIVHYLVWGSLGMTFTLIGAAPLIDGVVASVSWRRLMRRFDAALARRDDGIPWSGLVIVFLLVCGAANLGSYFLFEHLPHIEDSVAQYFHAKIFLLGHLTVPSPNPAEPFEFPHVIANGRWYSVYLPGHIVLLALGFLVHAPWLVNPVLGGLCVVMIYFVGKEMYDERIGRLAMVLAALSPFLLFMSSEFMNHTTALLAVELFLFGFARLIRRGRIADALLAGGGLGYVLLIRPLTAIAVGAPFAVYAAARWVQSPIRQRDDVRRSATRWGLMLLVFALFGCGVLAYNYLTNGNPFLFGYVVRYGEGHEIGFGHSGWGEPHTPHAGVMQTLNNLNALNKYLFEWPIPSLVFAALALAAPRANGWDVLLALYPLAMAVAYFFYWFEDWCFGPRFMFEAIAGLVLLTARGIAAMPELMAALFSMACARRVRGWASVIVVLAFGIGWGSNIPALVRLYGNNYWNVNGKVLELVRKEGIDNAIVFVRGSYQSAFSANDPLLRASVIYARDLGPAQNAMLMDRFPDREFFIADDRSLTKVSR